MRAAQQASSLHHLERALSVVRAVADSGQLTGSDLPSRTGLPRSTAHRLAHQLADLGLLTYDQATRRFRVGPEIFDIAFRGVLDRDLGTALWGRLRKLAERTKETAIFARLMGSTVSVLMAEMPSGGGRTNVAPALGPAPHLTCSSSRAIFAFQSEAFIEELLVKKHKRFTDKTILDRGKLRQELVRVRAQGYAVCDEEIDLGVTSMCVPVHLRDAGVLFSVGLVAPTGRITRNNERDIAAYLTEEAGDMASVIERQCVGRPCDLTLGVQPAASGERSRRAAE